jgi:hypothetical protein
MQLKRCYDISKKMQWEDTPLEKDPVMYIFVEGGSVITERSQHLFENITGKQLRHNKQVSK